jgi:hypothetical protein
LFGGLDHGVFAADIVGRHRQIDLLPEAADDIQVGQGRFDHDDVGALLHVHGGLADGFLALAGSIW